MGASGTDPGVNLKGLTDFHEAWLEWRTESDMISYSVVSLVAFVTAGLTLYSGFGLGTVLMPVFALFYPV